MLSSYTVRGLVQDAYVRLRTDMRPAGSIVAGWENGFHDAGEEDFKDLIEDIKSRPAFQQAAQHL
jgi:hypothetical protein